MYPGRAPTGTKKKRQKIRRASDGRSLDAHLRLPNFHCTLIILISFINIDNIYIYLKKCLSSRVALVTHPKNTERESNMRKQGVAATPVANFAVNQLKL